MTSQAQRHVMQQKYLIRTNVLSNPGKHHQGQSQRPEPKIRAILGSTTSGSPNGQRNRSQNPQGQSQRSAPPKPEPMLPAPTIRAISASTRTIRANGRLRNAFRQTGKRFFESHKQVGEGDEEI